MWKTLSLNTVTHKRFLMPVYFVLGSALVPLNTLIPDMRDVQNAIPSSRQNPKILRIDDAEVVGD